MSRPIEDPVTVERDYAYGTETTHPAFGQIAVHRYHGGRTALYGSDFLHNTYIGISIHQSTLNRSLHTDRHHATLAPMAEVYLSEAQWATFVSSFGQGGGTPCTLASFNHRQIPGLPDPQSRVDQFKMEVDGKLDGLQQQLRDLEAQIDSIGLSAKKAGELKSTLGSVQMNLGPNLDFVAKRFGEHVEETTEKAKVEIHGYMQSVIARAGLQALGAVDAPLLLEGDDR